MEVLLDYNFEEENCNIKSHCGLYETNYYMTKDIMDCDVDLSVRFIKSAERLVRKDPDYKKYLAYVKETLGLNRCSILGRVDSESASIELHHGPIMNLFDICRIVLLDQLDTYGKATAYSVAEEVMELHFKNKIQFVMLSEVIHQSVHGANRFINLKHAYGDIGWFIKRYLKHFTTYQINVIRKYAHLSNKYDSDVLDLAKISEDVGEFGY